MAQPLRRRRLMRLIRVVLLTYFGLVLLATLFQRRLLYVPTHVTAAVAEKEAQDVGFLPWGNSSGQTIGWQMPANGPSAGSVLVVHGNAGTAFGRDYLAEPLHHALNVNVFVLEYPGFGARPGSPNRTSLLAAAEEAFRLMPTNQPRYVVSESLGTGVASGLAKHHPTEVAGLAMFVPYHNLPSVAQRNMPFLPAYWLLLDRFDPEADLKAYQGPVEFVIAGGDEILGPDTGKRLFEGYAGVKQLQVIPAAGHNDVAVQSADWWQNVFRFWQQNARNAPSTQPGHSP